MQYNIYALLQPFGQSKRTPPPPLKDGLAIRKREEGGSAASNELVRCILGVIGKPAVPYGKVEGKGEGADAFLDRGPRRTGILNSCPNERALAGGKSNIVYHEIPVMTRLNGGKVVFLGRGGTWTCRGGGRQYSKVMQGTAESMPINESRQLRQPPGEKLEEEEGGKNCQGKCEKQGCSVLSSRL